MKIDTKSARSALPPRREPYWARIDTGAFLGYRSLPEGEGTWIARWRDPDTGKQNYRALGTLADYTEAKKEAETWFRELAGGAKPEAATVETACRLYVADRLAVKGKQTAADAEGRFTRLVYGTKFGALPLFKLQPVQLKRWLQDQIASADEDDLDEIRKAKDSANRNLSTLKAALNLAHRDRLVSSDSGWSTVTGFEKVGKRRERFLNAADRNALLDACPADLALLVEALLLTACRPGEIAAATVADFDRNTGALTPMPLS
ncbi:hypothetical protein EWI61_09010 [Methylolobus aquaticus]|nr:hypothetical protein EWI61_09010 [Methylolobus aquaticus]